MALGGCGHWYGHPEHRQRASWPPGAVSPLRPSFVHDHTQGMCLSAVSHSTRPVAMWRVRLLARLIDEDTGMQRSQVTP